MKVSTPESQERTVPSAEHVVSRGSGVLVANGRHTASGPPLQDRPGQEPNAYDQNAELPLERAADRHRSSEAAKQLAKQASGRQRRIHAASPRPLYATLARVERALRESAS
jgi:hypothetical protein